MRLRVYDLSIEMVRAASRHARVIAREDPDLARQLRRACTSVPLNLAEGLYSRKRNREARLHTAMGSAKETMACLDVAAAIGYIEEEDVNAERVRLDWIIAILWKLIHRPRK